MLGEGRVYKMRGFLSGVLKGLAGASPLRFHLYQAVTLQLATPCSRAKIDTLDFGEDG